MIGALTTPDGQGVPAPGALRVAQADVLALWRDAFDAARVVPDDSAPSTDGEIPRQTMREHKPGGRHGDQQGATVGERAANGDHERPDGGRAPARGGTAEAPGDAAGALPVAQAHPPATVIDVAVAERAPSGMTPPALASMFTQPGAVGRLAAEAARTAPGVERTPSPLAAAERLLPRRSEAVQREAAAARPLRLPSEPETLPPAESVRVYHGAHGLQVVVRHVGLAPQSAVWCALETARQLAGDRRALQQVTLNGRSVYEGPAVEPQATPATAVVLFTC